MLKFVWLVNFWIFTGYVWAQEIRFPDEELNQEVVYPVVDKVYGATMNRKVTLKFKGDLFFSGLYRGDEPFYSRGIIDGGIGFYFNEIHGVSLSAFYFFPGRSAAGVALAQAVSSVDNGQVRKYDATLVPHPQSAFFLNYVLTPLYGKHSFSKSLVTNFNVSFIFGLGVLDLAQNQNGVQLSLNLESVLLRPVVRLGVEQRVFIGNRFYLHGKFGVLTYYGSNPVNQNALNTSVAVNKEDVQDSFQFFGSDREVFIFRNIAGLGLGVLL